MPVPRNAVMRKDRGYVCIGEGEGEGQEMDD